MSHMTQTAWLAALEACGGDLSKEDILNVIYKDGPNALWSDTVRQLMVTNNGIYNYLTGFFPTRVWKDWQGTQELQTIYHPAYIPFDMSILRRSGEICDPRSLNECHTDYCEIPQGGTSNIPQLEFYKYGAKTKPLCIANIRTNDQVRQVAEYLIKERYSVDEQFMNIFYTWAVIRMLGHKWVLEYTKDVNGDIIPVPSVNQYNMLGGYRFSYMNPLFPQVGNINNVAAIDFNFLDQFGRALVNSNNPNYIAKGPRNTPIFELWHAEDIYRQEIIDNPEYVDRMKYTMMTDMLPGYRQLDTDGNPIKTEKEIIGNFNFRQVSALPRFAESTQGGLTVVQQKQEVAVDQGTRAIHNFREWDNAPILLTIALGKGVGEILTRPTLSTGIEGRPIQPITGDPNGEWVYRNDYDPECNEDLNMPHFRKRYEMGFRMLNPDAGWGFLSRAKRFRLRPINTCDLRPIFQVAPPAGDCDILTIGCNTLNGAVHGTNDITETVDVRRLLCTAKACGSDTIYRLTFTRENIDSISPDQNPIQGCDCGDTVTLIINDTDTGEYKKQVTATLTDNIRGNMVNNYMWYVTLGAPLNADECIAGVVCLDATPKVAEVSDCTDVSAGRVRFHVDSFLECGLGATVTITYYDVDDVSLDTVSGTIALVDPLKYIYEITSAEEDWACGFVEGTCRITITCP